MEQKVKKGLFFFIFIVLFLPFTEQQWPFINSGGLHGYYSNSQDIGIKINNWFDGTYQENKGKFINDHIGFRPDMLRLAGQIDFSLFQRVGYGGATIGKNNYLYFTEYLDAYFGKDFAGYPVLKERMVKLKAIQDTLSSLGKTVVLVYAPCKAWYYPEYIPGTYKPGIHFNNYILSKRIGDSLGIYQLDFNSWFLAMKDTTHELLFSKLGIHWTNYGAILGADSLARYINRVRNIHMPYAAWDKVVHTTQARAPDDDLSNIANLIFPMAIDTFCYPVLKYPKDKTTTKPVAIFMGDSFVINLLRTEVIQNMYADWQFWFYSRCVLNEKDWDNAEHILIKDYDWKSELKKADCIIIINTAMNCKNISDGFIEKIYNHYYPGK